MLTRSSFKRPEYKRAPPSKPAMCRPGVTVFAANDAVLAQPKSEPRRNPHLLTLARGMFCLLLVPGVCQGGTETTVACHSNLQCHGKAGARKADDCYSAWGCMACHRWLDQGPATFEVKEAAFMAGHLRQVLEWRGIAADSQRPAKARAAVLWALGNLAATPLGEAPI